MDASNLSANEARKEILNLADNYSYQEVLRELVTRLSGDDARDFVEHFYDTVLEN